MGGGRVAPQFSDKKGQWGRGVPKKVMPPHKKYQTFLHFSNKHGAKKRPCSAKLLRGFLAALAACLVAHEDISSIKGRSRTAATSKMERFVIIVNS